LVGIVWVDRAWLADPEPLSWPSRPTLRAICSISLARSVDRWLPSGWLDGLRPQILAA